MNLHLEHVEDYLLTGDIIQAVDVLYSVTDALTGKHQLHLKVTTKYDGAPAIVFGVNPDNNRFFIGTKSVFNKTIPKICYDEKDIDNYYSHQPELAQKLQIVLSALRFDHMNALIPLGIYQADLLWTPDSKVIDDRTVSFTPNTITYRANLESAVGIECRARQIGMVVHTEYEGPSMSELRARYDIDQVMFWNSTVVFVDPSFHSEDYSLQQIEFNTIGDHLNYVEKSFKLIHDRTIYDRHGKAMKMFFNHCIRIGEDDPEVSMYETFLKNRKDAKSLAPEVAQRPQIFKLIFSMHKHLTECKKIIMNGFNRINKDFFTEVNGVPTNGEGYVVIYHGVPCKFVDRFEFSRLNFANKRFDKAAA